MSAPALVHHLDTAACSQLSPAVVAAVVAHLHKEAEFGGYGAESEAEPVIDSARRRLATLVGEPGHRVAFGENATSMFARLVAGWPLPAVARVGVLPSEYAPNRLALAARPGVELVELSADPTGRLDLDGLATGLTAGLDLVTFPLVASHRGVLQPAAQTVAVCRAAGVPLVLDVAQALGQVAVPAGASAYVGTSRKWLGGPRGVGFVVADPDCVDVPALESHEATIAGRVGLAAALAEWEPGRTVHIAMLATAARHRLDGMAGWRVVEPLVEPTGILTLRPPAGAAEPAVVKQRLRAAGILVTAAEVDRAPRDMAGPVLRVSPPADALSASIEALAKALPAASRA